MEKKVICTFRGFDHARYWFNYIQDYFNCNNIIEGVFKPKNLEIIFENRHIKFISSLTNKDRIQLEIQSKDTKVIPFCEYNLEGNFKNTLDEIL